MCKKCTESKEPVIQEIYKEAFADNKVIEQISKQILKNTEARGRREIYDLVLKAALDAVNVAFIEHLCEKCAKFSNDVIDYLDQKLKGNEFDNTYKSTLITLPNTGNKDIIVTVLSHSNLSKRITMSR
ncbi:hypothetical protein IHO40_00305 [Wolbachia endosymbiont of Mansonella ozzardi]|uniref:hypothetical protein n=1 Tax=Wolbachia endosymbiont of Mansonella ozzardi TaxID=137464 RepID=UPI001CE1D906|nr:hypothetical protein [Wolbachia endosymbiont of Mansonella ozzardi]MCA4774631.1 hypothetical protein [Wolbachia endosymbiont of Mansonella ozzardi]